MGVGSLVGACSEGQAGVRCPGMGVGCLVAGHWGHAIWSLVVVILMLLRRDVIFLISAFVGTVRQSMLHIHQMII